jgi:hypothetical protein
MASSPDAVSRVKVYEKAHPVISSWQGCDSVVAPKLTETENFQDELKNIRG